MNLTIEELEGRLREDLPHLRMCSIGSSIFTWKEYKDGKITALESKISNKVLNHINSSGIKMLGKKISNAFDEAKNSVSGS